MHIQNYWTNKGHQYGLCYVNPTSSLKYVNIPKCASTWTRQVFESLGWHMDIYRDHQSIRDLDSIVVLRDPVDRWLSGVCEYFTLYHPDIDTRQFNTAFFELLTDRVAFDDHTDKQVYFIDDLDLGKCKFFMCDGGYRDKFSAYMTSLGVSNTYNQIDYKHTTSASPLRAKFKKIFEPVLHDSKYMNRIKAYYAEDYELIEKYGTR